MKHNHHSLPASHPRFLRCATLFSNTATPGSGCSFVSSQHFLLFCISLSLFHLNTSYTSVFHFHFFHLNTPSALSKLSTPHFDSFMYFHFNIFLSRYFTFVFSSQHLCPCTLVTILVLHAAFHSHFLFYKVSLLTM